MKSMGTAMEGLNVDFIFQKITEPFRVATGQVVTFRSQILQLRGEKGLSRNECNSGIHMILSNAVAGSSQDRHRLMEPRPSYNAGHADWCRNKKHTIIPSPTIYSSITEANLSMIFCWISSYYLTG